MKLNIIKILLLLILISDLYIIIYKRIYKLYIYIQ